MVSSLEELGTLLEESNLTPADIEYIVNFMSKENISPQLAMRRIKAFESLQSKLDNNEDKEKIDLLELELQEIKNQLIEKTQRLQKLEQEKTGLVSEKEQLESKSELIDSEREELQRQLEMIKDMQFDDEEDDETNVNIEKIKQLQDDIEKVKNTRTEFEPLISPFTNVLQKIIDGKDFEFDVDQYQTQLEKVLEENKKVIEGDKPESSEIPSGRKVPQSDDTGYVKPSERLKMEREKEQKEKSQKIEEIRDEDSSEDEKSAEKKEISKKVEKTKSEPEKKVSEKEEQVINLFLEFVDEAETDKGFQERISTICDMDEAYQYLGSIGLSQVYSFASRGMDKKKELQELLKSWKKEGIPR